MYAYEAPFVDALSPPIGSHQTIEGAISQLWPYRANQEVGPPLLIGGPVSVLLNELGGC